MGPLSTLVVPGGPTPFATVALGGLASASVRKLYVRNRAALGPAGVSPRLWTTLAERLGRNARVLDWARALVTDGRHLDLEDLLRKLPSLAEVKGNRLTVAHLDQLAAHYLTTVAYAAAKEEVGPDVPTFLARARVFEVAVPAQAMEPMAEGMSLTPEEALPRLANLGLVEVGEHRGSPVWRVNPLVLAQFEAPDPARWHRAAALWFRQAAQTSRGWKRAETQQAWAHALHGQDEPLADELGLRLRGWLHGRGLYHDNHGLAKRHHRTFPRGVVALWWAGDTARHVGNVEHGRALLEQAAEHAVAGTEPHDKTAAVLHALGGARREAGELEGAQQALEQSLAMDRRLYGTDDHPGVSATLHALAGVLQAQGDLSGARDHLVQSLAMDRRLYGTDDHPGVSATLHALA
ncbi:MAG: tetratricopeptide repeat protein, partial [Myxococcota bacterium]